MPDSTLDLEEGAPAITPPGHDNNSLGPSDSSDSGSDIQGAARRPMDVDDELDAHALEQGAAGRASDTDSAGTGERASSDGDSNFEADADIQPDTRADLAQSAEEEVSDPAPLDDDASLIVDDTDLDKDVDGDDDSE
ncbi:MAG: chemotaxis protein [Janthinobacterium lividum]